MNVSPVSVCKIPMHFMHIHVVWNTIPEFKISAYLCFPMYVLVTCFIEDGK